jgi:hypothetical protein
MRRLCDTTSGYPKEGTMSQCHDTYDLMDRIETCSVHIDLRQGQAAVYAVAAITFDGEAVVGQGEAPYRAEQDGIAARSAAGRALVALGQALLAQRPSDVRSQ